MAQTIRKNLTVSLTVATTAIESFDVTNHVGVSVTVKAPASGAGTFKLQFTNIVSATDADWTDVPTSIIATGTIVSGGSATISSISGIRAAFVRVVATVSAGAGSYQINYLGKEY